jgi:hypothetical protein
MDMSETYGNTGNSGTQHDDATRELGSVEVSSTPGVLGGTDLGSDGTSTTGSGTTGAGSTGSVGGGSSSTGTSGSSGTKDVAKEEARATGQQAKEGARHVAEVGTDEVKNVAQETGQQAKELWQQTRSQLLDQSAQQQSRVAEGLRSLSQELSSMASGSEQQGVASDLAQQASTRMSDVAGWLDQRDPGSLVSEVKQFARQRPGAFLATAAVIGLVGGRLSRGLVADSQGQSDSTGSTAGSSSVDASLAGDPATSVDHSTAGYSAYGSPTGTQAPVAGSPVSGGPLGEAEGVSGGTGPVSGFGNDTGESLR